MCPIAHTRIVLEVNISIITITWNSAETIRDTFESVLHQDYSDYEFIVIDGGSSDGTIDLIREYEPKFGGRMCWISESDGGIYDAMNKGIDMAKGRIVGLLNSDDFYTSSDVLSTLAAGFEQHPGIDAVYGDVRYVKWHDVRKMVRYYSSKRFKRGWMRLGFMPAHPSFYCLKSTYERFKLDGNKITGFKGNPNRAYFNTTYKIAGDFECLLRMIFVGRIKTQYIEKDCVTMRIGGVSTSGIKAHNQINRDHLRAFKENNIYSNYFLISLRYVYKIGELFLDKIQRMLP